jgi:hypothetical protein
MQIKIEQYDHTHLRSSATKLRTIPHYGPLSSQNANFFTQVKPVDHIGASETWVDEIHLWDLSKGHRCVWHVRMSVFMLVPTATQISLGFRF